MTEQERSERSAEHYRRMRSELDRRLSLDPELRQLSKKIKNGKADFNDTFRYSEIVSKYIGEIMQENIGEITNPLGKQYVCEALLSDHYDTINDVLGTVQVSLDEKLGIHLKPIKAPKPVERIKQVAHALEDPGVKPSVIRRRAGAPVVNTAMSMHDDYIRINAQKRNDLGFKCYLNRVAVSGCCKWCTEVAGRYVYGDHPDDIFRRHDNCDCTVTFENGRQRQDVWSKRSWEVPANGAGASAPVRLSEEDAKDIEMHQLSKITGLDFGAMPGKDTTAVADMAFINSDAFASKFKGKYENEAVENAVVSACRQIVKNRNGTYYEEAFFIDAQTGEIFSYVKGKQKSGVNMSEKLKKRLTNAPENSIIMIHNHPNSSPLSTDDYTTSTKYAALYEVLACGHNGDVYAFRKTYGTAGNTIHYANGKSECETVRDFRIAYSKHRERLGLEDYMARHLAWEKTSEQRGFIYEKR